MTVSTCGPLLLFPHCACNGHHVKLVGHVLVFLGKQRPARLLTEENTLFSIDVIDVISITYLTEGTTLISIDVISITLLAEGMTLFSIDVISIT